MSAVRHESNNRAHKDDTGAVAPDLVVEVIGLVEQVVHCLGRFGLLNGLVVLLAHLDGEVLVDDLANQAPAVAIVHREEVTAVGDDLIGDVQIRSS
jgi:hypothetical protein